MTHQNDFTLSEALLEQLSAGGLDVLPRLFQVAQALSSCPGSFKLPRLFQVLLNAAMQIERQKHLGAALLLDTPEDSRYNEVPPQRRAA